MPVENEWHSFCVWNFSIHSRETQRTTIVVNFSFVLFAVTRNDWIYRNLFAWNCPAVTDRKSNRTRWNSVFFTFVLVITDNHADTLGFILISHELIESGEPLLVIHSRKSKAHTQANVIISISADIYTSFHLISMKTVWWISKTLTWNKLKFSKFSIGFFNWFSCRWKYESNPIPSFDV